MDRTSLAEACRTLPLFPLPGTVLMPANPLPLHVFEPRYRQLVRDCLGSGGPLAVPEVRAGPAVDMSGAPPFLPYAGVGVIAAHHARPDGRFNILLEPVGRVRIEEELSDTGHPYRVGRAVLLEDEPVSEVELGRVGERIRGLLATILGRAGEPGAKMLAALQAIADVRVADATAGIAFQDVDARQTFLREDNPVRRAQLVESAVLALLADGMGAGAEA